MTYASHAVAYIRKSAVQPGKTHLSWEVQEGEVRRLAATHGDADVEILSDWGRSGRGEKTYLRKGYLELRERIESGDVNVVYAYSLSRLARSLSDYASLAELCRDRGVRIRLCKEGEFDYATPTGRMIVGVLALFAQMEVEIMQERARDNYVVRRARGDKFGAPPYGKKFAGPGVVVDNPDEDVALILRLFDETHSYGRAARALNELGVPARRGGKWSVTSLKRVVLTNRGIPWPVYQTKGRIPNGARLAKLLRCACGQTMTPASRGDGKYLRYWCFRSAADARHPRPSSIAERKLMPWVMAEVARLRPPASVLISRSASAGVTAALHERRERILQNFEDGLTDKASRDAKLDAIGAELARTVLVARHVPETIDWTWPPREINHALRAIFEVIELGDAMKPVRAVWRAPEWRSDDEETG